MSVVLWGARRGDRQFGSRSDLLMAKMERDFSALRRKFLAAITPSEQGASTKRGEANG